MAANKPIRKPIAWMILPSSALFVFLTVLLTDFYFFYRTGPDAGTDTVVIPKGVNLDEVTEILWYAGFIDPPQSFYWTARLSGADRDIQAGEYRIPRRATQADILSILLEGKTILHPITVPEGLTSRQVVALLMADERLTGEIVEVPGEGTLLPETYFYSRGDSRRDILRRMAQNQDEFFETLWANYDFSQPFTTREEAVILASIIEEETAIPEERPLIAAVFLNRLNRNMRLQSDPTVIYGLTQGEPLGHALRVSELRSETPYNTYNIDGLPPGPISNPGKESLEAVFNPAPTAALYFVADGTGGHVFAETLEEHNENVRRWRQIERENSGS